jgi:hypothetical protein
MAAVSATSQHKDAAGLQAIHPSGLQSVKAKAKATAPLLIDRTAVRKGRYRWANQRHGSQMKRLATAMMNDTSSACWWASMKPSGV